MRQPQRPEPDLTLVAKHISFTKRSCFRHAGQRDFVKRVLTAG
ncbi:MAG: hypothetical protein QOC62_1494 [Mycobacterium sp.]|jgi:hypothetical protein|nr:hypothetical protein [Mycobacterium sp.]